MTIQEKEKLYNQIMEMLSPIVFKKLMNIFESKVQSAEEGFSFKNKNSVIKFDPNIKNGYADTDIFKDGTKEFKVKEIILPKSGVISYNLYNINNMNINKALKHKVNVDGKPIKYDKLTNPATKSEIDSIEYFIKRSALYIKSLLKDKEVDIITYPETSKNKDDVGFESFNYVMTQALLKLYPNSHGIKFMPEILVKNVKNIFVNVDVAKEVGLSTEEIYQLKKDVEKWKHEADIISLRKRIDILEEQIAAVVATRGKGRPPKTFTDKKKEIELIKQEIKLLKQKHKILGRDSTKVSKTGKAKDWQIKSLSDKRRRAIEGIFELNPKYKEIQYKLKNKHIVIFDDNISSGATLDDVCLALQNLGVASITAITIGVIPATVYGSDRYKNQHNADKLNLNVDNMDWYYNWRSTDVDY